MNCRGLKPPAIQKVIYNKIAHDLNHGLFYFDIIFVTNYFAFLTSVINLFAMFT
jgi:hypothetical protein